MKLNCKESKILLNAYIDNELPQDDISMLEEHVKNCPQCKKELHALTSTVNLVNCMHKIPAPPAFSHKMHMRIDKEMKKPFWEIFAPRNLFAFAYGSQAGLVFIMAVITLTLSIMLLVKMENASPPVDQASDEETINVTISPFYESTKGTPQIAKQEDPTGITKKQDIASSSKVPLNTVATAPLPESIAEKEKLPANPTHYALKDKDPIFYPLENDSWLNDTAPKKQNNPPTESTAVKTPTEDSGKYNRSPQLPPANYSLLKIAKQEFPAENLRTPRTSKENSPPSALLEHTFASSPKHVETQTNPDAITIPVKFHYFQEEPLLIIARLHFNNDKKLDKIEILSKLNDHTMRISLIRGLQNYDWKAFLTKYHLDNPTYKMDFVLAREGMTLKHIES
ncbi:MAG: hypothetical protein A2Y62_19905 [Candidatus Fischerbacteria bacterium RBG_13_37_8]|uniref:Putative zinc-finger domain-containing protein n=1 Tax=Candidatus Fischerbacteria bacterium RBG_13_37_8 TaxID=1817863 RepID=A0A1F5VPV4_9BACT|nr:MAG: hypothetical protein A2Y62_19905 [Candidatus Fischerbacteria bacterium RBG_13_37_8]